MNWNWRRLQ